METFSLSVEKLANAGRYVTKIGSGFGYGEVFLLAKEVRCYSLNGFSLHACMTDVYMTVAGGLKIVEPTVDFAVAVAVASSLLERPVSARSTFVGEISLSGEVRGCSHLSTRVQEAAKMGFERIFVPAATWAQESSRMSSRPSIEVVAVRSIHNLEMFLN